MATALLAILPPVMVVVVDAALVRARPGRIGEIAWQRDRLSPGQGRGCRRDSRAAAASGARDSAPGRYARTRGSALRAHSQLRAVGQILGRARRAGAHHRICPRRSGAASSDITPSTRSSICAMPAVASEHRGHGIFGALIAKVLARLVPVTAIVPPQNRFERRRPPGKFGFRPTGSPRRAASFAGSRGAVKRRGYHPGDRPGPTSNHSSSGSVVGLRRDDNSGSERAHVRHGHGDPRRGAQILRAREVVHGVSCAVADGELVVVVGPSGCGKSTLLRHGRRARSRSAPGTVADRRADRQRGRAQGPRHRDGVPELRALPAYERLRQHGLRPARCGTCAGAEIARPGRRRRRDPAASTSSSSGSRASSPAASASAWRWAARSCATRRCSCSTSRCPTSTPSCGCRCGSRSSKLQQRARHHRALRHPRPGRGDDAGRPRSS